MAVLSCKGKGFNCPTCKNKNTCEQSIYLKPIGLESKEIWLKLRKKDIIEAIKRYADSNEKIPQEWYQELNELIEKGI